MVARAVTQAYDDALRETGLRVTQYSLLAKIGRLGSASVTQLTELLALEQTTLTRNLQLLEANGLIERTPHPDAASNRSA